MRSRSQDDSESEDSQRGTNKDKKGEDSFDAKTFQSVVFPNRDRVSFNVRNGKMLNLAVPKTTSRQTLATIND